MTLGGRKIAPDALLGFHTADEIGAVVDPQSGEVIDTVAHEIPGDEPITKEAEAPEPEEAIKKPPESPKPERPDEPEREPPRPSQKEASKEEVKPDRPYPPARVKKAVLSRASRGSQLVAKMGFRGLICGNLEAIWITQRPDARVANRHSVLNFLFADPSSEKLTTGQCNALNAWLMEKQPVGPDALNPYAVAEANAIVNVWNEQAGQQLLEMPSELAGDGVPSEDIPI